MDPRHLKLFAKELSADRIHDHFDAFRREFAHDVHEIGFGVVNRVADANFAKKFLFGGTSRAEDFDAARPRELHGGNAHSTGGAMNEDSVAGKQIAHCEHRVVGRNVITGDGGSVLEGHSRRKAKNLARRNGSPFGIGVKTGEGSNGVTRA